MVTNDREFSEPMLIYCNRRASSEMFKHHGTDCVSHVKPESYLLCRHLHRQATHYRLLYIIDTLLTHDNPVYT